MIVDTDKFCFYSAEVHDSKPRYDGEYLTLSRPKDSRSASLVPVQLKFVRYTSYSTDGTWRARKSGGWTEEHPWEVVAWFEENSE